MELTHQQCGIVDQPVPGHIFIEGPAGTGKTTAAVSRLLRLLNTGVPGSTILVLLPQRTLGTPYHELISSSAPMPGGIVTLVTAGGLAQRMVRLFWPLIAGEAGFVQPDAPPQFLTMETAQYHMAKLVAPLLEKGYFESVAIDRNRLFSQIIDNLNKASIVGFPHSEIGDRLKAAWAGKPSQLRVFEDVQDCANQFRQICLQHNLLDFSLQIEVFRKYVWNLPICKKYLTNTYQHLITDNIEEDTPFAHNLIAEWLPDLESALLVYDHHAGYRRFLGADPDGAYLIKDLCTTQLVFEDSLVAPKPIIALGTHIEHILFHHPPPILTVDPRPALVFHTSRYYPQMLDWVAERVAHLVHEQGASPSEIVIVAPYMSDALRYGLSHRLAQNSIPIRTHRPSRSLREEPVTHVLITLAKLAHPAWNSIITKSDVSFALQQTIDGLDLIRGQLLAEIVFRIRNGIPQLQPFDQIIASTQERITFLAGERYDRLRNWIELYRAYPPLELDHFFAVIFGELLSQPGYRFHASYDSGSITARLIESAQKFRQVVSASLVELSIPPGEEYIRMVEEGVIAAQYVESWQRQDENAVLLSPAYSFLMSNYPVSFQFWLDVSSRSWSDRLAQPLTHPYVLSRYWPRDKVWTDADEVDTRLNALYRLITGLLNRCRQQIYLGICDLGEQGYEQRGPLIRAINRVLQDYASQ